MIMLKYIIFYSILVIGTFLSVHVVQRAIEIKHPPYIKFPYKGAAYAIVCFYELSRAGKGSYTEYRYKSINQKWRYLINKDHLTAKIIICGIFIIGTVIAAVSQGISSVEPSTNLFFLVTILLVLTAGYFPARGYLLLLESLKEK